MIICAANAECGKSLLKNVVNVAFSNYENIIIKEIMEKEKEKKND